MDTKIFEILNNFKFIKMYKKLYWTDSALTSNPIEVKLMFNSRVCLPKPPATSTSEKRHCVGMIDRKSVTTS